MLKQLGVFYFLLLMFLIIAAFYIGFSWDILAFAGAASRVSRELEGQGGQVGSTSPGVSTGTTTTPTVNL
jgi:hypothetical protein